MKKALWFNLFLILIIIIFGGLLSLSFLNPKDRGTEAIIPGPIVIEKTVYPEPQIEYRDRIIEELQLNVDVLRELLAKAKNTPPKEVIKIIEVPIVPRWFKSEEELKTWLSKYPIWGGLDCDDLQEMLMFDAFKDGFIITPIPVFYGKVFDEPVLNVGISGVIDFGAWSWIDNSLYYVDLRLKLPHYRKITVTRD